MKRDDLIDCLSYAGLRELPEKWDEKSYYLSAIVEVKKVDGSTNYAIQRTKLNGEKYLAKVYGRVVGISKIGDIYPYDFLKEQYMFNGTKEEKLRFLKIRFPYEPVVWEELTAKEIKKYLIMAAIESQYQQDIK